MPHFNFCSPSQLLELDRSNIGHDYLRSFKTVITPMFSIVEAFCLVIKLSIMEDIKSQERPQEASPAWHRVCFLSKSSYSNSARVDSALQTQDSTDNKIQVFLERSIKSMNLRNMNIKASQPQEMMLFNRQNSVFWNNQKINFLQSAWWHIPVIPMIRRLKQEDCEFRPVQATKQNHVSATKGRVIT